MTNVVEKKAPRRRRIPFEAILKRVGGNSRYQFLVFVLMSLAKFCPSMMATLPVLIAYKQDYTCSNDSIKENEIPGDGEIVYDKCFVYRNKTRNLTVPCNSWAFDTSIFETTIRSQYLLVCDRGFLAEFSTTLFFMGFVLGSIGYGLLSDRYGRMVGILSSGTHLSLAGLGAAFAPNYWSFAMFRFVAGIANGGLLATAFTMMAEVTDKKHRVIYCELVHNGFSYGSCLIAMIGYLERDCFKIQLIVACLIMLVWVFPLAIPESPRWLYTTGRTKRAEKAIKFVARINRRPLDETTCNRFFGRDTEETAAVIEEEEEEEEEQLQAAGKTSLMEILRERPLFFTTIINWFSWFTASIGFFATMYTLGDIGGNIFLTLFVSALVEIPARVVAIYTAKRWGRIPTISVCLVVGGIGCFINAMLIGLNVASVGQQTLSILNKFWMAGAFDTIWTYSGELYPTIIRNIGVGAGSMWARIGGMLAPQVSLLFQVWAPLPLVVMGALPFTAGLLVFLLPETLNKDMLEDIKDMLRLVIQNGRVGQPRRNSRHLVALNLRSEEEKKSNVEAVA